MKNILFPLLIAIGLGFVAGNQWTKHAQDASKSSGGASSSTNVVAYDYTPPAPAISSDQAKRLREQSYRDLQSVSNVLELPTLFSRKEALHTLAGRADESAIKEMIQQAININDRYQRNASLEVLFLRYAEINPESATDYLFEINLDTYDMIIDDIFSAWARIDIAAAIAKSNSIENAARRKASGSAILEAVKRTDPGSLQLIADQLVDGYSVSRYKAEAIGVRANYDPRTALQEALNLGSLHAQREAANRTATVWARTDPEAALESASDISNELVRMNFVQSVIYRWISDDPENAIQKLIANPVISEDSTFMSHSISVFASSDPQAAMAMINQLPESQRPDLTQSVYAAWATQNADAAIQHLQSTPDSAEKTRWLGNIFATVSNTNPQKAFELFEALPIDQLGTLQQQISRDFGHSDPKRAINLLRRLPPSHTRERSIQELIRHAAWRKPALTAELLDELPKGPKRDEMYRSLIFEWTEKDPIAAQSWIASLPAESQQTANSAFAIGLARKEPRRAAEYIDQSTGENRTRLISSIAFSLAIKNPEEALIWLDQYRDDPDYGAGVSSITRIISKTNPQRGLDLARQLPEEHRSGAVSMVLGEWTRKDPQHAANLAQNSDSSIREQALTTVANRWGESDPEAAISWATSLASGPDRDAALLGLVTSRIDIHAATDLINSMKSAVKRDDAIFRAYTNFMRSRSDQSTANKFLDDTKAGDEVRQRIRDYGGG